MTTARRIAGPQAKNRAVLLDAAERLLLTEGYAAVTSRRVAAEAGLKPQLVHYYFATMDDLYLAVFRRRAEEGLVRQAAALASDDPLRALWEFSLDDAGTALTYEFVALANHRKEIRSEIARYAERFRTMQVAALVDILESAGVDTSAFPPGGGVGLPHEPLAGADHGADARTHRRTCRRGGRRRAVHRTARPLTRSCSVSSDRRSDRPDRSGEALSRRPEAHRRVGDELEGAARLVGAPP